MKLTDAFIDFITAPKANCLSCKTALGADKGFLCAGCYSSLRPLYLTEEGTNKICMRCGSEITGLRCRCHASIENSITAYSAYHFIAPVSPLVKIFKYSHVTALSGWMADELTLALRGDRSFDIITCVPSHFLRRLKRGYNQSEILALALSNRISVPFSNLLKKHRYTLNQARLSGQKRRINLINSFKYIGPDIKGKRILLVDDVRTTGSTIINCAKLLKENGAQSVIAVTLCAPGKK